MCVSVCVHVCLAACNNSVFVLLLCHSMELRYPQLTRINMVNDLLNSSVELYINSTDICTSTISLAEVPFYDA